MIYELGKNDYKLVKPMLEHGFQFPEAAAVVELNNVGKIFVDDLRSPKSALLWAQGLEGFFLLGDESNVEFVKELGRFIDTGLSQSLQSEKLEWFEVAGMHRKWDKQIEQLFHDRDVEISTQFVYKYPVNSDSAKHDIELDSLSDYQFIKVDSSFLTSPEIENMDFLIKELLSFWESMEKFLSSGIAYCVVHGHFIVSVCYSGFVSGTTHTIGVLTMEAYRKKGLAYRAACLCMKEYARKNIMPYWDCSKDNDASWKLAEKLGFVREAEYSVYYFPKR